MLDIGGKRMRDKLLKKPGIKKLRTRFWVALILLSIPSMFLLGAVSYHISKQTIVENHIQNYQDLLRTSSEMSELTYESVINLHRLVLSNEEIRNELLLVANGSTDYYETAIILNDILSQYTLNTKYIESVCLFDVEDKSYCYGISRKGSYFFNNVQEIKTKDWYHRAKEARGKEIFLSHNILNGSNDSFSSVKLLRNPNDLSRDALGVLVINLSKKMFEAISMNYGETTFMIVDRSERSSPVSVYINNQNKEFSNTVLNELENSQFEALENKGFLSSSYTNPITGWSYIHLINEDYLLKDSNKIGVITFTFAGLMVIIAVFISIYLSDTILQPLIKLKKMVANITHYQQDLGGLGNDEVGNIGKQIKILVKNNIDLNEKLLQSRLKEKESELRALQAQIKPHFLYNTLSAIYWMAIKNNVREIATMTISLSESFKLSLNRGKELLTVQEELDHIQHYSSIQTIRYGNRFKYIENVQTRMKNKMILKLILQPFVENAYYHGLEAKMGEGYVKLTGYMENDQMIFIIEDNGIGMKNTNLLNKGYGIKNVKERLELLYGKNYSLEIESEHDKGTIVTIRISLDQEVK